ncbi:MAG: T9SS type A sorting domain-containing protein, partial [Bacteroidetes bacterium]|nr:T9SS type A sorting domain-containing protein [Bacteroidota bacterium]
KDLSGSSVPVSPIYVTFNINPGMPGGGPPSGFVTEMGNMQTHNVLATLPTDMNYSPLWSVRIYDNADFNTVLNLDSISSANVLVNGAALVNCPVVSINGTNGILDPMTASVTPVDRFSSDAGTLMVRDSANGLPAANAPIDYDMAPFITTGFGPMGEIVEYYNFDVQPLTPAPIYVLFKNGESTPVSGQLNIIDVKPGDMDYNDFWLVNKVTVPASYVANSVTSYQQIVDAGYDIETTTDIVNCPVVPEGSTAGKRYNNGDASLTTGWYKDSLVYYFNFVEKTLSGPMVPTSPIYVTFNINPGMPGGGPASGFVTDSGGVQTHNVVATLPEDATYSPLWRVNVYDNADFDNVMDLTSAGAANILATSVAFVNCPVVTVESATSILNPLPLSDIEVSIYPNPVENHLTIKLQSPLAARVKVSIINILGKEIFVSSEEIRGANYSSFDLSNLSQGIYYVNIQEEGKLGIVRKVVKR